MIFLSKQKHIEHRYESIQNFAEVWALKNCNYVQTYRSRSKYSTTHLFFHIFIKKMFVRIFVFYDEQLQIYKNLKIVTLVSIIVNFSKINFTTESLI